jgi:hypothetical protein
LAGSTVFLHLCAMSTAQEPKVTLPALNLPHFQPSLRQAEGKLWIFDFLRKKYLILTPEEWVRQHWIHYLIDHHQYPKGLFSMEKGLKYNKLSKRTDLIVFDRLGKPYLLIECKAPDIQIDEKTLTQAMVYNSTVHSPNLVLSNGLRHIYLAHSDDQMKFVQQDRLPLSPY